MLSILFLESSRPTSQELFEPDCLVCAHLSTAASGRVSALATLLMLRIDHRATKFTRHLRRRHHRDGQPAHSARPHARRPMHSRPSKRPLIRLRLWLPRSTAPAATPTPTARGGPGTRASRQSHGGSSTTSTRADAACRTTTGAITTLRGSGRSWIRPASASNARTCRSRRSPERASMV